MGEDGAKMSKNDYLNPPTKEHGREKIEDRKRPFVQWIRKFHLKRGKNHSQNTETTSAHPLKYTEEL